MANTVNNPSGGSVDGGGAKPFDWSGISKNILNNQGFPDNSNVKNTRQQAILQAQKDLLDIEKNKQFLLSTNKSEPLTAEDKFYESLGIKKSSGGWGIQSRPMGRLLVAVVLVAGYFAYKKFKK
jgi:hypothetical protein